MKAGRVIVEQGDIREETYGKSLHIDPGYDPGLVPDIARWFEDHYSIQFANYPVDASYLHSPEVVACGK